MERAKTNLGVAAIIAAVCLIAALPIRVYQLLKVVEKDGSGFFISWSQPTIWILYGICAALIIAMIILTAKGSKKTLYNSPQGKSAAIGVFAGLFSLSLIADAIFQGMNAFGIISEKYVVSQLVGGDTFGQSSVYFLSVEAVFAVLSAVYFGIMAIHYFTKSIDYRNQKILAISPIIWLIARLMLRFMKTVTYKYVSELMLELFMLIFAALFFMAFIRLAAGVTVDGAQRKIFGYGLLAFFFCMLCSVPRYIVVILGDTSSFFSQGSVYNVCDLAMGMIIAALMFGVMGEMQFKSVEEFAKSE